MKTTVYEHYGETVCEETLENGLRILVALKPGFRKTYAMFTTRYGGSDRRFRINGEWIDTPAGVAHFLEHKMFDLPDGSNALPVLASRGASPNAYTSDSVTAYHFTCTDGFEENLRTLLTFVSTPYFTEESVAKEQGIIAQEIRMTEDEPDYRCYLGLVRSLFDHHPVRDSVAGTVESIAEITPETLYACHKVFYHPSNMVLTVVGDVDPERIAAIAREILPSGTQEKPERDYGTDEGVLPVKTFAEEHMEIAQPLFALGAKLQYRGSGREKLRFALLGDLSLDYLLGESSPFYTELYEKGLLTRNFGSGIDSGAESMIAELSGESRDPLAVAEAFRQAVSELACKGPDKARFERCKKAMYGAQLFEWEGFRAIASSFTQGHFHGWNPMETLDVLNELTADDVCAWLCEWLAPERLALSVVWPNGNAGEEEDES